MLHKLCLNKNIISIMLDTAQTFHIQKCHCFHVYLTCLVCWIYLYCLAEGAKVC